MTTQELIDAVGLKPMSKFDHRDITGVFVSDMVSDVMAGAKSGNLWLTVQTHKSIIPAANLVDVAAIVITSGKQIPQETMDLASQHNVAILWSNLPTFELIGKLYGLGVAA